MLPYMKPWRMDRVMICAFVLCILLTVAPLQALNMAALQNAPAPDPRQLKNPALAQDTLPLYMPVTIPSIQKASQQLPARQQSPAVVRVSQRTVLISPVPHPTITRHPIPEPPRPSRIQPAATPARQLAQKPVQTSAQKPVQTPAENSGALPVGVPYLTNQTGKTPVIPAVHIP